MKAIQDNAGVSGWVRVSVNNELRWEGSNLVTDVGLEYCATLLAGLATVVGATYETVDTIRLGNGGSSHLVTAPTVPVAPVKSDVALAAEIVKSTGGPYDQNVGIAVASNVVTFTASFLSDDLVNGDFPPTDGATVPQSLFVNEAGLWVNPQSVLFARVTFPSIAFAPTSGTTLAIEWIVGYR